MNCFTVEKIERDPENASVFPFTTTQAGALASLIPGHMDLCVNPLLKCVVMGTMHVFGQEDAWSSQNFDDTCERGRRGKAFILQ